MNKTISYYTNQTAEPWSISSLFRGIGGSQTAVIYLSNHWAKLGHQVAVFNNLDTQEGDYNGVNYYHYKKFNPTDYVDILIIWRDLEILDQELNAQQIFLDLHDVPRGEDFTYARVEKIDKIFVKSQYQKNKLPPHCVDKVEILPNGVDVDIFLSTDQSIRETSKLMYASDYYRGLELMLRIGWPIIRREIPEATLNIFYGWNFFDTVWRGDEEKQAWKQKMINLMNQPGVKEYGRVSQTTLAEHLKKTNILYYGCTFEEIDCITVRQAAVAGSIPCTTNYATLANKPYSIKIDGNPIAEETHRLLANKIIELIKFPKENKVESLRNSFQSEARKESWNWVAEKWAEFF